MEIEVKIEELRKKKIFVATPMYGIQKPLQTLRLFQRSMEWT
jgi:hypothetical protein